MIKKLLNSILLFFAKVYILEETGGPVDPWFKITSYNKVREFSLLPSAERFADKLFKDFDQVLVSLVPLRKGYSYVLKRNKDYRSYGIGYNRVHYFAHNSEGVSTRVVTICSEELEATFRRVPKNIYIQLK